MIELIHIVQKKAEEIRELEIFVGVCRTALHQAVKSVEAIDLRRKIAEMLEQEPDFKSESELNDAKEHAAKVSEFAGNQSKDGLPYLHSLCAVRLWALVEATIDELVVHSLLTPSEYYDQKVLAKLKGPLIEFRSASPDEQAEFLAETLKQLVDAPLKIGAGKFEALLDPVALGGTIKDIVRRNLFELSQIRNIIVHKSGKADRRLVEACPWLNLKKGDNVHVTHKMFECYRLAVYWYMIALRSRIEARYNIENDMDLEPIFQMIENELEGVAIDKGVPAD